MKNLLHKLLFTILLLGTASIAFANYQEQGEKKADEKKVNSKFNPGEFIMDHISDSYEWHVITVKGHHYSVPLPVIVYSEKTGWNVFLSSEFHHHAEYKGFSIPKEGKYKGKIVEHINGEEVRPFDISITKNVVAILVSLALMLWIFISVAKSYAARKGKAPKGLQSFIEPVILFIRDDIAIPAIGEKKYERYMPFLLTLFFFIWINNIMGLIPILPGGANVTGNITVTMVLGLLTFVITTFSGNKNYWKHIFNTPGVPVWLKLPIPLMPVVELFGVFTKPLVLMIRLFANISAGHMVVLAFVSLIFIFSQLHVVAGAGVSILSVSFIIFMDFLELLVALIQAYVFTLLSALYFGMATEEHH